MFTEETEVLSDALSLYHNWKTEPASCKLTLLQPVPMLAWRLHLLQGGCICCMRLYLLDGGMLRYMKATPCLLETVLPTGGCTLCLEAELAAQRLYIIPAWRLYKRLGS